MLFRSSNGNLGKAKELLTKALEVKSDYVDARFELGRLYYNQEQYDEAIEQFEIAVQLFPDHSNSIYSLGLAYQKKGDNAKALEMFKKVLELNPGNTEIQERINEVSGSSESESETEEETVNTEE